MDTWQNNLNEIYLTNKLKNVIPKAEKWKYPPDITIKVEVIII